MDSGPSKQIMSVFFHGLYSLIKLDSRKLKSIENNKKEIVQLREDVNTLVSTKLKVVLNAPFSHLEKHGDSIQSIQKRILRETGNLHGFEHNGKIETKAW